jgi:DNA-binding CsgD family transcriptional regulator
MLLGRDTEQDRIRRLLADARESHSGVLVIRGEPGIGKSALLEYAREQADDMTVLSARGLESESELPFAGLSELLGPLLDHLDAIPAPQRGALEGGLALRSGGPADRFAAYAGVLSLLAAAAEQWPLLVLVDDAHWLDLPSSEALVFAARRLGAEAVAVLFAAREGERRTFMAPGLPETRLVGLEVDSALALLSERLDGEVSLAVAERLCSAVAGNPLALLELRDLLTAGQLKGRDPLPDPLPLGASVEDAYRHRLGRLPRPTRGALTVAAASDTGAADEVRAALEALHLDPSALELAETAGIVALSPERVEFRHPLLRSAAYHSGTGPERRAAHEGLAGALHDERSLGRRAWHRAKAAAAPDEEVASELEQAAQAAMGRGAPAAAASAMEVAARLTPEPDRRARRLQDAGLDAYLAGRFADAARLLDDALERTDDPVGAAEIRHLRGQVELFAGSPRAAREHMLAAATAVEPLDPGRAVLALADAAGTLAMQGRHTHALETAERAHALAEQIGGLPAMASAVVLGAATAMCGQSARAAELVERARPLLEGEALAGHQWLGPVFAQSRTWLDEDLEARQLIRRTVEALRSASALAFLPWALAVQCNVEFRLGNWADAYAAGSESLRLGKDTGQRNEVVQSRVALARVDAGYGRREACVTHAQAALAIVHATDYGAGGAQARAALGLLELGSDRPREAAEQLDASERFHEGVGQPTVMRSMADHVEAHLRAGTLTNAEGVLAVLEEQAERTGGRWAKAAAARCRGLLASQTEFEEYFLDALVWHKKVPAPFETARTRLCFGERLRRARRSADAREQLRGALNSFERLGAAPWENKARRELDATGERRERRPAADVAKPLTPQELQVVLRVSEGATTKEVAAALFISPRTVDAHLNRIYRKLGVRSRVELTRVVLEGHLRPAEP